MKNLDVLIFSKQLKTRFIKLNKSHSNYVVLNMFLNQQKKLFIENEIYLNENYLVVLSKIIDQKINSVKTTFRSKRGKIYIDEISKYIASLILTKDKCLLFSEYKKLVLKFNLRQKEQKIFKYLLGQKLLFLLSKLKGECDEISRIILKSQKINKLTKHNKQILNLAQIYSVANFNKNSTMILNKIENINTSINDFFFELYETQHKIKIIILYLINIFS